jgi:cbb3-type cytochrome oxidase maturation protein
VDIIFALIPLSLLLLGLAIWAFFWAVRSGQFDDMDTPGWRVLLDDEENARSTDTPDASAERGETPLAGERSESDSTTANAASRAGPRRDR